MTVTLSDDEQNRLLDILSYWHKLEFFIPFDLDKPVAEAEQGRIRELSAKNLSEPLHRLWFAPLPPQWEIRGFSLYLAVFPKSEITRICERVIHSGQKGNEYEERERTNLEGRTCFAKLNISPLGELLWEPNAVSISTVPWALGQIETQGLSALASTNFDHAQNRIRELVQNFLVSREIPPASSDSEESVHPLSPSDILALHRMFCEWASYSPPSNQPIAVLEVRAAERKPEKAVKQDAAKQQQEEQEESEEEEDTEPEIGILNSFFLQEIELAIAAVRSGSIPSTLKSYLTPLARQGRIHLDSEAGLRTILDVLHPKRMNRGHWFDKPEDAMSLMQQFAIHSALQLTNAPDLLSINGPPGTGKTTLLRDVVAENVVRRARALSRLKKAGDAFEPNKLLVQFGANGEALRLVKLKPELTGWEMVVASSNNAAVENLSRDLPKKGTVIGQYWPHAKYLQPVAHKIAAQTKKGAFKKLPASDAPWGLISCALGKTANRRKFWERFSILKVPPHTKPNWSGFDQPQRIWEWIDHYRGPSFRKAVADFQAIEEKVQAKIRPLSDCADLLAKRVAAVAIAAFSQAQENLAKATRCRDARGTEIEEIKNKIQKMVERYAALQEEERLIDRASPGWWSRLWRTGAARTHAKQVQENAAAQLQVRRQLFGLEEHLTASSLPAWKAACEEAETAEQEWQRAQAECLAQEESWQQKRGEFSASPLPDQLRDLETDAFQKRGLWQDKELASLRSSLFASALIVHEAWLAEAGKSESKGGQGFRRNIVAIGKLMGNKRPNDPEHVRLVWQSLFLMIPVVSTTFASFANQFRGLPPGSLGWLFIDEAGQAVPQAATGALLRAQRAVVVGDPRQIEPVFTLPTRLISSLAELSPWTANGEYGPHQTSVQALADRANRYGIDLLDGEDSSLWIGSPLRVHRRCIEPMFSCSNRIAYNNRMVFGLESFEQPNRSPLPCDSAWIDVKGRVRKGQAVPEQTQFITLLLAALYQWEGRLPGLYIISPFRAVKNEITKSLENAQWTKGRPDLSPPAQQELRKWCKERVGTVHTFQGKEEDSVIMVLGADHGCAGAARWASSKPNLLNVALTRAKRRFYIVGDWQLWSDLGPFQLAAEKLKRKSTNEFWAELLLQEPVSNKQFSLHADLEG